MASRASCSSSRHESASWSPRSLSRRRGSPDRDGSHRPLPDARYRAPAPRVDDQSGEPRPPTGAGAFDPWIGDGADRAVRRAGHGSRTCPHRRAGRSSGHVGGGRSLRDRRRLAAGRRRLGGADDGHRRSRRPVPGGRPRAQPEPGSRCISLSRAGPFCRAHPGRSDLCARAPGIRRPPPACGPSAPTWRDTPPRPCGPRPRVLERLRPARCHGSRRPGRGRTRGGGRCRRGFCLSVPGAVAGLGFRPAVDRTPRRYRRDGGPHGSCRHLHRRARLRHLGALYPWPPDAARDARRQSGRDSPSPCRCRGRPGPRLAVRGDDGRVGGCLDRSGS